ncbi:MAG: GAF domain-containing protein [Chloroflexi bacterium]|nr:GAF domain-containing protein [Chloroflexota bacterium]
MNQTDTARRRLADVPLRLKLYIGLGASIAGLLVVAGITIYTSVANQQLVSRSLTRERQLADLASEINSRLLTVQNQAFEFYDTWDSTGFEKPDQGGFERAREIYVTPLQEQLEQVRHNVAEMERLEPDEDTRAILASTLSSVDAYEITLLQMSDHMESLGFRESGEIGQLRAAMGELQSLLDETGLESPKATALEIRRQEKNFFLYSDLASARRAQEAIRQLKEQIAATDDDQLTPADRTRLNGSLERYYDHFLAAANHLNLVDLSRGTLISQSDLTSLLVSDLFERQQAEFGITVEQLLRRQSTATSTVIGLTALTFLISVAIAYVVAGQIIRPVRMLGEAARRLGAGELDVRATVHGHDEIGSTAAAFNLMADRLQEVLAGLEQQVADRTRELERRSIYLETSADVGRAVSSILDADQLTRRVVELIRARFGLYYVGLFLVEEAGEWATLQAGTGEAGRAMLARGHRIRVGEGMIGWSVANAQARIALDVGEDAVRLATVELPDTRSEAALPLRSRGRVMGALTIQSDQPAAFDEDTVVVLQTMADQVAVALDNARLFTEAQAALEAERQAYGELSRKAWTELLSAQPDISYRSDEHGVTSARDIWRPEMERALQESRIVHGRVLSPSRGDRAGSDARLPLAVPIKVRGNVVGVLDTYKPADAGAWTPEEVALLKALTDQLGVALESARLYQDTQRRAARERLAREITDKMRRAAGVDSIIQVAVDELFGVLGTSRAFVRLGTAPSAQDDGEDKP